MKNLSHAIQNGFILVATLWVLAAMTVAAGFFSLWVQHGVEIARQAQLSAQAEIDLYGTRETLLYLLTTQGAGVNGIALPQSGVNEQIHNVYQATHLLRLDDTAYQGLGDTGFALQDENGLLEINYFYPPHLRRFLGLSGIDSGQRDPLIAKLSDYTDVDDLHRINGAESYHYKKAGRLPPTNRRLRTNLEVKRIIGWDEQESLWRNGDWEHFTTVAGVTMININTAPERVLLAVYGITRPLAKKIIAKRPFMDFDDMVQRLKIPSTQVERDESMFYPSRFLRMSLWRKDSPVMQRLHIKLRPLADKRQPWDVTYQLELPKRSEYSAPFTEEPELRRIFTYDDGL